MILRIITNDVESALQRQAAVALIGPRQVGKTTLALEIGRARDALYLDLEDRYDRNRLAQPALFSTTWRIGSSSWTRSTGCRNSLRRCAASSIGGGARAMR